MSPAALPLPSHLLPDGRVELLERLTEGLEGEALWWLSGYAAGLARARADRAVDALPSPVGALTATVIYGSQTGNARRVAERVSAQLGEAGISVRLVAAGEYPLRELRTEKLLVVVISTQGDGDPPDDGRGFVEHLLGPRAPRLEGVRFGVLGLGDSSYPHFCAIGRQLDARFAELGADRWLERGDADVDIDEVAGPWTTAAVDAARALSPLRTLATVTPLRPAASRTFDRDHPFAAPLLGGQKITARGAARDIRHVELSLEGSGLSYEPGDALGVWPTNPPTLVAELLDVLRLDGDTHVSHRNRELPLRDWLLREREITRLARPFLARLGERAGAAEVATLLQPGHESELARLLDRVQLIDVLRRHGAAWSAEELVAALRPLTPRLYSIASSPLEVGEEAHLTVAHVEYQADGHTRWGTASNHLARAGAGDVLPVYIEHNERFRLPKDPSRDVLMVGPGTGVAPFRGFVQHRAHTGAAGRHWLFFGAPHARTDFLYQLEWQQALKRGQLDRLDVAFSRDQPQKVYVQHRLREHGRDVYAWLDSGAHLYVCGATAMARDVHAALVEIAMQHGALEREGAIAWLDALQAQGRYARDVY